MAKKNKDLDLVEAHKLPMPSDNIVEEIRPDDWPTRMLIPPTEMVVVQATIVPEKPKVDVNKVLFEMIALMGTVDVFESQVRIIRAVAAYYNLLEEMGS